MISLAIWPSAGLISQAYTSDKAVIAMASAALVLSCLFFLVDALQVVIAQASASGSDASSGNRRGGGLGGSTRRPRGMYMGGM